MYLPKLYREEEKKNIQDFLRRNNFAAIVSFDGVRPVTTHIPTELVENDQGELVIYGHMSRANPQWQTFGENQVLLIFQGPHAYISARWYNHVNVPTWNYTIIHVYGRVKEIQGEELYALLSRLVYNHESTTSYRLETLPQDFVQREINGVYGFAVEVQSIDAGFKLSQNRNDEDFWNIVSELEERADGDSKAIADAMRERRKK